MVFPFVVKRNTKNLIVPIHLMKRIASGTESDDGVAMSEGAINIPYTSITKCSYMREGDTADTAITPVGMSIGTWASGGFVKIDDTNAPGLYNFGVPNACLAQGASWCMIIVQFVNTTAVGDFSLLFSLVRSLAY